MFFAGLSFAYLSNPEKVNAPGPGDKLVVTPKLFGVIPKPVFAAVLEAADPIELISKPIGLKIIPEVGGRPATKLMTQLTGKLARKTIGRFLIDEAISGAVDYAFNWKGRLLDWLYRDKEYAPIDEMGKPPSTRECTKAACQ